MTRYQILAIWVSFLVLELLAFINAFVFDLKGGTIDAERFQSAASNWAESGEWIFAVNSEFFIQYIGLIYRAFGENEFIATQFGILALLFSVILCIKLAREVGIVMPALAILLLVIWPSMALRVTTTLREPYMVLFLTGALYALFRLSKTGQLAYACVAFLSIGLGALFHKALAVLAPFLLILLLHYAMKKQRYRIFSGTGLILLAILVFAVIALLGFAGTETQIKGLKPLQALLVWDTELIAGIVDYKTGRDFRTTYDAGLKFGGPLVFLLSVAKSFIYYMFMPFPWHWRSPLDLFAGLEAIFRFGGLMLMLRYSIFGRELPNALRPVCVIGLLLMFIWAVGTANYGTASRHHLTTNWLFLLIYIACFSRFSVARFSTGSAAAIRQN